MRVRLSKLILTFAAVLVLGFVFVACVKAKVDVPDKSTVTFSVDWSALKSTDGVTTASIYLYEKGGNQQPIVLKGVSVEKTTAEVPAGTYRVIVHNENLKQINMRNASSYLEFESYLVPSSRPDFDKYNSKGASLETVIPSVEYLHLLTGTASRELVVEGGEPFSFTLRPKTATSTFRFTLRIPSRLDYSEITSVLGGVASKMSLFEAKPLSIDISSVDIALTTAPNAAKDTIIGRGSIEVFGVDPANRNAWSNTLYLHLVPRDKDAVGKTNFEIDLTSYFDKYNNQNLDIDVKVDNPNPDDPTDVEFEITVKPWIIEDGGHVDVEPNE